MTRYDRNPLKCSIAFLVLMAAGRGGQAGFSCREYDKMIQCEQIESFKDVAMAAEFLRKYPDAETIYIGISDLDLLPNDFFKTNTFKEIRFWSCRMKEMPHRTINPVCGNLEILKFEGSAIESKTLPAGGFRHCTQLRELFLASNGIRTISPSAFQGLINLKKMYLDGNKIKRLNKGVFLDLDKLDTLLLRFGQLESLEEGVFDPISKTIKALFLSDNPFRCDCSLQWLKDWLRVQASKMPNFIFQYPESKLKCNTPVKGDWETLTFCNKTAPSMEQLKPEQVVTNRTDMQAIAMLELIHCTIRKDCTFDNILPKLWSTIRLLNSIPSLQRKK